MTKRLTEIDVGKSVKIKSIEGGLGMRQRLCELGLYPEEKVTIKNSGILRGPIVLKVGEHQIAIGRGLANKILVEEYQ
ncbi:MAG: FeoA family protein [Candidatus Methanofastidiosia archaeon]